MIGIAKITCFSCFKEFELMTCIHTIQEDNVEATCPHCNELLVLYFQKDTIKMLKN